MVPFDPASYPSSLLNAQVPEDRYLDSPVRDRKSVANLSLVSQNSLSSWKGTMTSPLDNHTTASSPRDAKFGRLFSMFEKAKQEYIEVPKGELVGKRVKAKFLRDTSENLLLHIRDMQEEVAPGLLDDIRKMKDNAASCAVSLTFGRKRAFDKAEDAQLARAPKGPRGRKRNDKNRPSALDHAKPRRDSTRGPSRGTRVEERRPSYGVEGPGRSLDRDALDSPRDQVWRDDRGQAKYSHRAKAYDSYRPRHD